MRAAVVLLALLAALACAARARAQLSDTPTAWLKCNLTASYCVCGWETACLPFPEQVAKTSLFVGYTFYINPYGAAYTASLQRAHACGSAAAYAVPWVHMLLATTNVTVTSWCTDGVPELTLPSLYFAPAITVRGYGATISRLHVRLSSPLNDSSALANTTTLYGLGYYVGVRSATPLSALDVSMLRQGADSAVYAANVTDVTIRDVTMHNASLRVTANDCGNTDHFNVDGLSIDNVHTQGATLNYGVVLINQAVGTITVRNVTHIGGGTYDPRAPTLPLASAAISLYDPTNRTRIETNGTVPDGMTLVTMDTSIALRAQCNVPDVQPTPSERAVVHNTATTVIILSVGLGIAVIVAIALGIDLCRKAHHEDTVRANAIVRHGFMGASTGDAANAAPKKGAAAPPGRTAAAAK